MIKKAKTKHKVIEIIKNRWSPRSFSGKEIDQESISSLFEAASWAASAFNEQPWRFIYATKNNDKIYKQILDSLIDWNQNWAKSAPLLILTVTKLKFSHNNEPNRTAFYDLGQAIGQLGLQASSMGLFVHQMTGFDNEKAEKTFNIPEGYIAVSVLAVGYLGKAKDLNEDLEKMEISPRERKNMDSFVFEGDFK
ncbi:MAG: nitroreductase [Bacteroidetes bacterium]|nr:MAG: nitroreductase [Bacteroidota bacterium]